MTAVYDLSKMSLEQQIQNSLFLLGIKFVTFDGENVYRVSNNGLRTNCGGINIVMVPCGTVFGDNWEVMTNRDTFRSPEDWGGVHHISCTGLTPYLLAGMMEHLPDMIGGDYVQACSEYNRNRSAGPWLSYYGVHHDFNRERWETCMEPPEEERCPNCGYESPNLYWDDDWGECGDCGYEWCPSDSPNEPACDDHHSSWANEPLDVDGREQYDTLVNDEDTWWFEEIDRYRGSDYDVWYGRINAGVWAEAQSFVLPYFGTVPTVVANLIFRIEEYVEGDGRDSSRWQRSYPLRPNTTFDQHVLSSMMDTLKNFGMFSISTNVANPGFMTTLRYLAHLRRKIMLDGQDWGVGMIQPEKFATNENERAHSLDSAIVYVRNPRAFECWQRRQRARSRIAQPSLYFDNGMTYFQLGHEERSLLV